MSLSNVVAYLGGLTPVLIVVVLLIIAAVAYWVLVGRDGMVVSSVDHESYNVREDYPNKAEAANILADINRLYVRMLNHMKKNKMNTPWAAQIEFLQKNYNPTVIGEHIPWSLNYTSYVAHKGKKVRFCLRLPGNRMRFHDRNTIRFVALHELAHMMTTSYGHAPDFWDTFRFLLKEAEALGEIEIVDYQRNPRMYCGIKIESNPALGGHGAIDDAPHLSGAYVPDTQWDDSIAHDLWRP